MIICIFLKCMSLIKQSTFYVDSYCELHKTANYIKSRESRNGVEVSYIC